VTDNTSSVMHLPVGSMLGEYCITGVIGQGGFSIVYLAYEASLDRTIAIKEFFPTVLAQRSVGQSVAVVSSSNQPIFKVGLESFLREAKLQAKFFHPALVEVIRVWEQNNSAYIAMRYHRGQNLREMKRSGMDLGAEQILSFVKPIFDALSLLHAHNVIHRDVSPDNILIRETGEPVLLDLGAARTVVAGMTQALTTVLKPGYAPIEQYADDGALEQGPWTDVYGLAAVVYFLYVGKAPPQAVTRIVSDSLTSDELLAAVPSAVRPVLRNALAVLPANRYRSIAAFRSALVEALDIREAAVASPEANGQRFAGTDDDQDDSTVVLPVRARQMATVNTSNSARSAPSTSTVSATTAEPRLPSRPPQAQPNPVTAAAQSRPLGTPTLTSTPTGERTATAPHSKQALQYGTAALAAVAAASIWIWTSRSPPAAGPGAVSIVQSSVPPAERSTTVTTPKPSADPQPESLPTRELPSTQSPPPPTSAPRPLVANEPAVAVNQPALSKVDPSPAAPPAVAPVAAALPAQRESKESLAWKRAMTSRSVFDLMAYLGKYPEGTHAKDARKSLPNTQRTSEGCLVRNALVHKFSWSGKCSDGMAIGPGVLKWATQTGVAGTFEGRGTLKNGIMVGRWIFDFSPAAPDPWAIVNRTVDFDNIGNVSRRQRYALQNGRQYEGETDANEKKYFGVLNGAGAYTNANGGEHRGQFILGKRHGPGVYTYKNHAQFKRLTASWVDARKEGQGKLEFLDGSALTGVFLRGKSGFDGVVKRLRSDGSVAETQVWRDGKPEGSDVSPIKEF
jgi:non-specific serine/threonine protein kinase